MTRRYFAANLPTGGGNVSLDEAESHHALNVMRIKVGESIMLFDGIGNEASATVHSLGRREVVCASSGITPVDRENRVKLTLGVAMPKGDRGKDLVERLTELGVNCLVPLHCRRIQWPVPENAVTKWHRVMIDACKQSGRNQFMNIAAPVALNSWLRVANELTGVTRYLAHPASDDSTIARHPCSVSNECYVAIGPEGGFSDEELALADASGWQRLPLGNRIYRIETAAIIAAVKISQL